MLLLVGGDRWWPATLLLFGPRWLFGLPLAALVPLAAWAGRRMVLPLAVAAVLLVGPVMGLCIPLGRLTASGEPTVRVLTCNVKGQCRDNYVLESLIRDSGADIVTLQGCWGPIAIDWPAGWQIVRQGEFIVASRFPIRDIPLPADGSFSQPRRDRILLHCAVESPRGDLPVVAVHLISPRDGIVRVVDRSTVISPSRSGPLEAQIDLRRQAAEEAARYVGALPDCVIVAGDFNLPTDSAIYRQQWAGLSNAFSRCGWGFGYTEWPYSRWCKFGVRIDHVLTGPAWQPLRCWVGQDVGSDHLPVLADLRLR